jgi:hypothetical protein
MAAALVAVLPLAFAVPAHAAGDTSDQSLILQTPRSWQTNIPDLAQTFTAGVTAQVDKVTLQGFTTGGFPGVNVSLHNVAPDGSPGTWIETATNPVSIACCMPEFTFNPKVAITAGVKYAIVVEVTFGNFTWYDSGSTDLYPGGSAYTLGRTWGTSTTHRDFGFADWVASNVNSAPNVAPTKTAVSVPEGTDATNTGSCSDPDGDTVTLSASQGAVTPTCMNGAWSWKQTAPDETTTQQTVIITANDGQGFTTPTHFTLDVTPVAPTATILSDPLSVPEGSPVPFTGGGTTPSAADAPSLRLDWSVTKNGSPYSIGSGQAFSFTPDDDGTYEVTFKVTDDGNMSDSKSMTVTATNVAPNAAITGVAGSVPLVTTAEEMLTFSGAVSDADKADAYTITWNFGDGAHASGLTVVTHAYASSGNYNVTFQVSDGEGGVGTATRTVSVQTTPQAIGSIASAVQALPGLTAGQKNSLLAKLNAAADAAARGNTTAAHNELNAFLNELQADVNSGKVTAAAAGNLRSAVHAIQGSLGTYNRFLEWWPLEA